MGTVYTDEDLDKYTGLNAQRFFQGLPPVPTLADQTAAVYNIGQNKFPGTQEQPVSLATVGKPNAAGVYTNESLGTAGSSVSMVTPPTTPSVVTPPTTLTQADAGFKSPANFSNAQAANDRLIKFLEDARQYNVANPGISSIPSPYKRSTAMALSEAAKNATDIAKSQSLADIGQVNATTSLERTRNLGEYEKGTLANKEEANTINASRIAEKAAYGQDKLANMLEIAKLRSEKTTDRDKNISALVDSGMSEADAVKFMATRGGGDQAIIDAIVGKSGANTNVGESHPDIQAGAKQYGIKPGQMLDLYKRYGAKIPKSAIDALIGGQ